MAAQKDKPLLCPDYSYCGYKASEEEIPMVSIQLRLGPIQGDATTAIQEALDQLATLPTTADGFRGALLLAPGEYRLATPLKIKASGLVLRGSGISGDATVLRYEGSADEPMLQLQGAGSQQRNTKKSCRLAEDLPLGGRTMVLKGQRLHVGDRLAISQGPHLCWERQVNAVDGRTVTLDAPLSYELSAAEASIVPIKNPGKLRLVGVENLVLQGGGICIDDAEDVWMRAIRFEQSVQEAVHVAAAARRITVQDCVYEGLSRDEGSSFYVQGSQVLCLRIQARGGCHDFAVGAAAHGPNAFVQCWSLLPQSYSGCIEAWSSGVLFDICSVSGNALRTNIPDYNNAFDGWTTTNTTLWNSTASMISVVKPEVLGNNYAYGAWGQFNGKGYWEGCNNHVSPWSLYYEQLEERLGHKSAETAKLMNKGDGGTSTIRDAEIQSLKARKPLPMLDEWIENLLKNENFIQ